VVLKGHRKEGNRRVETDERKKKERGVLHSPTADLEKSRKKSDSEKRVRDHTVTMFPKWYFSQPGGGSTEGGRTQK